MLTKISDVIFLTAHAQVTGNDFLNKFNFSNPGNTDPQNIFDSVIGTVLYWVIAIIGLIAFIYLIINGVKYITAGGDAAKATEARTGILNAIIGVIIVLIAFVILRFAAGLGQQVGNV